MKLAQAHPAQPTAVEEHIARYLAGDDGDLAAGVAALFSHHPGPANFAAFGAIIRAGVEALGPAGARVLLVETLRRSGGVARRGRGR